MKNPDYKGKWYPPMIENPSYIGEWKPNQIPNPHYFHDDAPHKLAPIDAIGFELWTMQNALLFDNILVSSNEQKAREFADQTWKVRKGIENAQKSLMEPTPKTEGSEGEGIISQLLNNGRWVLENYTTYVVLVVVGFIVFGVLTRIRRPSKAALPKADEAATTTTTRKKTPEKDSEDEKVEGSENESPEGKVRHRNVAKAKGATTN